MRIHYNESYIDITPTDDSFRNRAIMGDNNIQLEFSLNSFLELPIGSYVDFEGERYTLLRHENFTKRGTRNIEYILKLESNQGNLRKYKIRDSVEKRLKFDITATPQEHIQLIVDNLNERETGWVIGNCIDSHAKHIAYNHSTLEEALFQVAETFETEWEISGLTIHLRRLEYNSESPLSLSYGKGNGFVPGLGRGNIDKSDAVEILHVQGGERNIDRGAYGNKELLLPKDQTYTYQDREYVVSSDGRSIQRNDKALSTNFEDSLDLSNIYPSRVGTVTGVDVIDVETHLYDFIDTTIPGSLNYKDLIMAGETMTVIFQTGNLAGFEFEVDYIHSSRRFQIVPQDIDGITMPDPTFKPSVDDEYAIFGIMLPDAYIRDDVTETGASWDMFKEACKYLYENESPRFSFTGMMDKIWAKANWVSISGKLVLGGMVDFSDTQFLPDGEVIRITGIKDYLNNPHAPEIYLSNITKGSPVSKKLNKIQTNEVVTETLHNQSIAFSKRRYKSALETINMIADSIEGFSGAINPITVQTMALMIGDDSLQFRFVDSKTDPNEVTHVITYNNATKILTAPGGIIQHMTHGITELKSTIENSDYSFWDVSAFASSALSDASKAYYFYIKASSSGESATFVLSETAIKKNDVAGFYHFLVGILNSELDEERTFATMYGYTEVLPGRITSSNIHADTIEVNQLLASMIYASGATIGSLEIDPANVLANNCEGLRLGNIQDFNPTYGRKGILLGTELNEIEDKYKFLIGDHEKYMLWNGIDLIISGKAVVEGGATLGDMSGLSEMFEIVNAGLPGEFIRVKGNMSVDGDLEVFET